MTSQFGNSYLTFRNRFYFGGYLGKVIIYDFFVQEVVRLSRILYTDSSELENNQIAGNKE